MQHNLSEDLVTHTDKLLLEKSSTSSTGIVLQLFFSHGLASAGAVALVLLLPHLASTPSLSILTALIISGGLGLLLTANLVYDLRQVERTMTDMLHGRSISLPRFSWPLTSLFTYVSALDRRVQMYVRGEQAAAEMRRQYLQQASESATQAERQRIARDLHDTIKQQLFSISVSAATAKAYWSKDIAKAQAAVLDIQQVVKEAQVEMQALLQQLGSTPLENTKLADALRTQAEALKYRSGLTMNLTIGDLPADEQLPMGTQETIFRLVQETFANIARHARATAVTVTLQQSERALHLVVSDDGKGFDPSVAHAGMGLTNMRERVAALDGSIEMQSAPGQGTTIHIVVPFLQPQVSVVDTTWSEREIKQGIERAISSFQLSSTALNIAFFFGLCNWSHFFIQIPIMAIVVCLLITLYGLWQGHSWKGRLAAHVEKENVDRLRLQQREEQIVRTLLFLLFYGAHVLVAQTETVEAVISPIVSLLQMAMLSFFTWRLYRLQGRIYRAMTRDELQIEITYQRRKVITRTRFLIVAVPVVALFGEQLVSNHLPKSTLI